jgi:hypothetical protein
MSLRLFLINRLKSRFLVNLGVMFSAGMPGNRCKRLLSPMRLAPFLNGLVLLRMTLVDMRGRLFINRLFLDRRSSGRLLMGVNLG